MTNKDFLKKLKNYLFNKYLSFPTLKFLLNSKIDIVKNLYIDFCILISKKNKNFFNFFFSDNEENSRNTLYLDINENIANLENNCEEILKNNGILVIENALPKNEYFKIVEIFDNLKIKDNHSLRENECITKYFEEIKISDFLNLNKISNYFTKKVFGKPLKPLAQFHVHRSKKIPESIINGDNNMHIDRFLPNMKLYYAPFEITKDDAPFCYAVGSHKINSQYIKYVKSAKYFSEDDTKATEFLNCKKELVCKKNSLIVALTNGFHGRKSFLKIGSRQVVFLQYHKSFNKLSLIFG